jgi:hypothetical protein
MGINFEFLTLNRFLQQDFEFSFESDYRSIQLLCYFNVTLSEVFLLEAPQTFFLLLLIFAITLTTDETTLKLEGNDERN